MRLHLTDLLYGHIISTIPLFRGLSSEVISALCNACRPLNVLAKQEVMQEGQPGNEMYMIISGELEVTHGRMQRRVLLGFLSEGSFFGESAVLSQSTGSELRTRTVRAVTESELCFLTSEGLRELQPVYPELKARMTRFTNAGQMPNSKVMKKLFGNNGEKVMAFHASAYNEMRATVLSCRVDGGRGGRPGGSGQDPSKHLGQQDSYPLINSSSSNASITEKLRILAMQARRTTSAAQPMLPAPPTQGFGPNGPTGRVAPHAPAAAAAAAEEIYIGERLVQLEAKMEMRMGRMEGQLSAILEAVRSSAGGHGAAPV